MAQKATKPKEYRKYGGKFPWAVKDVIATSEEVFTGSPKVRAAWAEFELTEEQVLEFAKCAKDPIYFLKTYGRVLHIDHGLIPLDLYDFQEEMILNYKNNRFCLTVTCRQAGKTTAVVGFLAWFIIFHKDKECHVLANKEKGALEIMKRLRRLIEELPYFLQAGAISWNKGNIELDNGSAVTAHSSSSDSVRGVSAALLYIDEMAFLANDDDFWEATFPIISSGQESKVLTTSTPKGARGVFYKLWKGAPENEFQVLTVKWDRVPNRTPEWAEKQIAKIGKSRFSQEHECAFLGSSGALVPTEVLENMSFKNPILELDEGKYEILYRPDPERKYVAISDSSEGVGSDYSVTTVFDVSSIPYKVVAKFRDNETSPLMYPYDIEKLCKVYNDCPVLIESNNDVGGQVGYILYYTLEYENCLLTSPTRDKGLGMRIGGGKVGIKTTAKVKNIGCANLKTLLETGNLIIEDQTTIEELGTFIAKGTSYEADAGCNDDCVMTAVLFSWLVKQEWFTEYTETDVQDNIAKTYADKVLGDNGITEFFSSAQMAQEEEKEPSFYEFMSGEFKSDQEENSSRSDFEEMFKA